MSFPIISIQASGSPAQQDATGKKRSKTLSVIGYILRKRKTVSRPTEKRMPVEKPSYTMPSLVQLSKLSKEVSTKNAYECLTDYGIADKQLLEVETEEGDKEDLKTACRKGAESVTGVVSVKRHRKVVIKEAEACSRAGCQTCESVEVSTDDDKEESKQIEVIPRRLTAKLAAGKKTRFVYSRLLNYLRCKHFMHIRDHHFITTLVADARAWLLKDGMSMEKPLTFAILANAVTQAFMVNQEELDFRARIKNPIHLDHIEHLNNTMSGELGRVSIFAGKPLKSTLAAAARRPFTRAVRIPAGAKNLI